MVPVPALAKAIMTKKPRPMSERGKEARLGRVDSAEIVQPPPREKTAYLAVIQTTSRRTSQAYAKDHFSRCR